MDFSVKTIVLLTRCRPGTVAALRRYSATTARRCGRLKTKAFLAAAVAPLAASGEKSAMGSDSTVNAARKMAKSGEIAAASGEKSAIRDSLAVDAAGKKGGR